MRDLDPRIAVWADLGEALAAVTLAAGKAVNKKLRRRRRGAYLTRRPGPETPMWNACVEMLRIELQQRGAKVRLARYLGVPKQRVTDFVTNRSRMPDAETLLQILEWLSRRRAGEDLSL
tara:strand:- start:73 stop:429 length:357 start_codon:yes stop_codon:yes gene_type:complete